MSLFNPFSKGKKKVTSPTPAAGIGAATDTGSKPVIPEVKKKKKGFFGKMFSPITKTVKAVDKGVRKSVDAVTPGQGSKAIPSLWGGGKVTKTAPTTNSDSSLGDIMKKKKKMVEDE